MKLADLLHHWVSVEIPDRDISGLHNDSRQIKPGYLFFAYPGAAADGRLFIKQAVDAGAVAVIYDPQELPTAFKSPNDIPCLPLPALATKLAAIASRFYDDPSRKLSVTGVTGTNGKTTIAYQLAQACELLGDRAAYIGTIGQGSVQELQPLANTTPDALCLQHLLHDYEQQGVQHVCMEVSSHALSQNRADNIEFTQAIYTNLSHEHLDYHHTMAAYAAAKAMLFTNPSLTSAVINQDDEYADLMSKGLPSTCQKLTYGIHTVCDVRAHNVQITMTGSEFDVESPWGTHHLSTCILGEFNVYNSLAVFTALLAQGFAAKDVVPLMATLQATPGRMDLVAKEPCVIVDFAHTPDALENVLSALSNLKRARLGVVFGCGGDRDKGKRPMMGQIACKYADFILVTSDNPRTEDPVQIIDEITQGMSSETHVLKIVNREKAIEKALSMAGREDIILIAGKGHESYQQIGQERFPFSDQDVVRKLLNQRV